MKGRMAGMLAAGWLVAAGPGLAADFEGVISMAMTMHGKTGAPTMTMDYSTKGTRVRMEPQGRSAAMGGGVMLYDDATQRLIVLMPAQKAYLEMPANPPGAPKTPAAAGAKPVKTGKTQTLLGYAAEQWVAKDDRGSTEFWLAKGLGTFHTMAGLGRRHGTAESEAEKMFAAQGYFPLLVIVSDPAGAERTRMTVTKITKQSLADSIFVPPADYTKMDMPAGMPGMPGGMSGSRPGTPPGGGGMTPPAGAGAGASPARSTP